MQRAPVMEPEMLLFGVRISISEFLIRVRIRGCRYRDCDCGRGNVQVGRLLGVHDGGQRDTKVGDGSPEVCWSSIVSYIILGLTHSRSYRDRLQPSRASGAGAPGR